MVERWVWLPTALAAAWAVAAFGLPLVLFSDVADVDPDRILRLETQAGHWTKVPAFRVRTVEARETGPEPGGIDGRVVFRGIFGVPWGEITQEDGQGFADWRFVRQTMVWGVFVGVLVVLAACQLVVAVNADALRPRAR